MGFVTGFMGRHPLAVSVFILMFVAGAFWYAHDYVVNTLQPRQLAEARAGIAAQIASADKFLKSRKYPQALSTYRAVLATHDERLTPAEKGTLHHRTGQCLTGLAESGGLKANLTQAVAAFREALKFRDAASDLAGYAETQGELGEAQARLALETGDSALFDAAIAALGEALKARPAAADPKAYVETQVRIGNAHRERFATGEKQNDALMAPALAAYAEAARVAGDGGDMEAYARVNLERSLAYFKLSEGVFKRTNTREALMDLQRALAVFSRDRFPRDYGRAQRVLGDVYMRMFKEVPVNTGTAWRDSQQRTEWKLNAQRAYELASQFGAPTAPRPAVSDK